MMQTVEGALMLRSPLVKSRPRDILVEVVHPGRQPWTRSNVPVRLDPDGCHAAAMIIAVWTVRLLYG